MKTQKTGDMTLEELEARMKELHISRISFYLTQDGTFEASATQPACAPRPELHCDTINAHSTIAQAALNVLEAFEMVEWLRKVKT